MHEGLLSLIYFDNDFCVFSWSGQRTYKYSAGTVCASIYVQD